MALNIENTSGVPLDIDDFSITLAIGEIIDLSILIHPLEIAQSANGGDLDTHITSGDISVKDPIDGTTALSVADGLAASRAINETHWRLGSGSRLGDLSDVDLTGEADTVVLQFEIGSGNYVVATPSTLASDIAVGDLSDVVLTSLVSGQALTFDGSDWVNANIGDSDNATFGLEWRFSTTTTAADPGNGRFRYNNATLASVTEIYFDDLANSGVDASNLLNALVAGDKIYVQESDLAASAVLFTVVSSVDNVGWFTVTVTVDSDSGVLHGNNRKCIVGLILGIGSRDKWTSISTDTGGPLVPDSDSDTLTLAGGTNISTSGDAGTDTITFNWDGVTVEDEDVSVTNTPHTTFNFTGAGVTATDAGSGQVDITISGGGVAADMDAAQARRTTNYTLTASFADITHDTTDVENNTAVVEHDNTNTERLTLKTAGLYMIYYGMSIFPSSGSSEAHTEVASRVQANGAGGAVPGSSDQIEQIFDSSFTGDSTIESNMVRTFVYEATANDFLTLQAQTQNTTGTITIASENTVFGAVKMTGQTGATGPSGSGSVTVQEEGVTVTGGPHDTLNFIGSSVTATDGTGGVADITITPGGGTPGGADSNVQYNNGGAFGGEANFIYDDTLKRVAIDGIDETTQMTIGGTTDLANASNTALYIEVQDPSSLMHTGLHVFFNRQAANVNGFISYEYDGFTPNIDITDEDDDPPYIHFDVIGSGTRAAPEFVNRFGGRGPVAGATTGFSWYVSGTETMTHDTLFLNILSASGAFQLNGVDVMLPIGGTAGQVLEKIDATDYNVQWATPSSGSTIVVQEEGVTVTGGPHDTLNFVGAGVTATDGTGGVSTITIPGGASQNLFETFTPDSGGNIVADTTTDTLTLAGGSNITTVGTPASDIITIDLIDDPDFTGTGSITVTDGTTAERPVSPVNGMLRYNTTTAKFEVYENGAWRNMGTGGSGNLELYDENPVTPVLPSATGDNAVAIGDAATASAENAIAYGAQADASGGDSIAFGMNAQSSNDNSVAIGSDTTASGAASMALGEGVTSSATDSYAFGRNSSATAIGSMALLEDADSRLEGGVAQAAGQFAAKGDAQTTVLVSRNSTTDATVTELFLNGTSARLVLANDSSWAFKILVVARRTDANDESAMYQFLGGIDRNATAATTAIVGNVSKTVIAEDTAQWDCNVDADTTNGSLRIQVTGQAAKTIRWVARVELVEVTG